MIGALANLLRFQRIMQVCENFLRPVDSKVDDS